MKKFMLGGVVFWSLTGGAVTINAYCMIWLNKQGKPGNGMWTPVLNSNEDLICVRVRGIMACSRLNRRAFEFVKSKLLVAQTKLKRSDPTR